MTTAPHSSPAADTPVSAAEQTRAAALGAVLFRNRGWLPVPFVAVPLLAPSQLGPGQYATAWAVGALLVVCGEAFRLAGVAAAGTVTRRRSRPVQRLVTYGVFAWMRNPLYVGNFFAWLGVVVASGVLWFLPVAALLFAVEYTLIVRYEEGVLESIFGGEYLAYKARTPRWLPHPPHPPHPPEHGRPEHGRPEHGRPEHGPHAWGEAWRSEVSTLLQYVGLAAALGVKHWVTTR